VQDSRHVPVLLREVVAILEFRPGRVYVDGTVGGGGHARAILEKTSPSGFLIGVDRDAAALDRARENLAPFAGRFALFEESYANLKSVLHSLSMVTVDGVLLDLGLSSDQLEDPERGFTFRAEGPLDMRMGGRTEKTAQEFVNRASVPEMSRIIWEYGEERWANRIARAIDRRRKKNPIRTSRELAEVIAAAVPRRGRIHPATRTFQAIRIWVNDELQQLNDFLGVCPELLNPNGRVGIISFHSLEDRIVKQAFRSWAKDGRDHAFRLLTRKPVVPSREEVLSNPRARSAKFRAAEKLFPGGPDGRSGL
jgi:16S rRNA (cytosine1402-N4)-methyltransferase